MNFLDKITITENCIKLDEHDDGSAIMHIAEKNISDEMGNLVSKNGTALMACVVKGEFELVDKLLLNGANIDLKDQNGMTALMLAVQFNNSEMVKKLIKENANKELTCNQNKTAFEYAIEFKYEEIINLLK